MIKTLLLSSMILKSVVSYEVVTVNENYNIEHDLVQTYSKDGIYWIDNKENVKLGDKVFIIYKEDDLFFQKKLN